MKQTLELMAVALLFINRIGHARRCIVQARELRRMILDLKQGGKRMLLLLHDQCSLKPLCNRPLCEARSFVTNPATILLVSLIP